MPARLGPWRSLPPVPPWPSKFARTGRARTAGGLPPPLPFGFLGPPSAVLVALARLVLARCAWGIQNAALRPERAWEAANMTAVSCFVPLPKTTRYGILAVEVTQYESEQQNI